MRLLVLAAALACAQPSLDSDALCAEHAGAWDCAPGAVCVRTSSDWLSCVCCRPVLDGGYAIVEQNTAANCDEQRRFWATLCNADGGR